MSLYETLGVPRDADEKTIRAAYRRKASLHHPDRSNGDLEEMQKVQQAYDVLSDPVRRERYDASGDVTLPPPIREKAAGLLAHVLDHVLNEMLAQGKSAEHRSVVGAARSRLTMDLTEGTAMQMSTTKRIEIRREAMSRLLYSGGSANYAEAALQEQIQGLTGMMRKVEDQLEVIRETLTLLAEYGYRCDEVKKPEDLSWDEVFDKELLNAVKKTTWFNQNPG